jgi:predicted ATPase
MNFLKSIDLNGFLSFSSQSSAIELGSLNLLIGPNGSGKSNLIEAIELLRAAPSGFASAIRSGGGIGEWLWKGAPACDQATIEAVVISDLLPNLRYRLSFAEVGQRTEIVDEVVENAEKADSLADDVYFYYRYQQGRPVINTRQIPLTTTAIQQPWSPSQNVNRQLRRESLKPDESVLSQRVDADLYPELYWLGRQFSEIQSFGDWTFGKSAPLRRAQRTDLPTDSLVANSENLGLLLNELQLTDAGAEFNRLLTLFLPRFERMATRIQGNTVQLYLHERGLRAPIPATRLSDGTIRFLAILAQLLSPAPPPLLCIEEPELGLHPDAICLLADVLVEASTRTQLIVTTHSDALVSGLTDCASSVLVCENRNGTQIERVEPGKLEQWLDKYRLGDIWRMGQIGGNP